MTVRECLRICVAREHQKESEPLNVHVFSRLERCIYSTAICTFACMGGGQQQSDKTFVYAGKCSTAYCLHSPFFGGGGAYVWVRVIIFSECKYLEHFTSIKFTVASHILSLRFHFPLQLKDHSEPILVTCRFLSVSYRKIVIRLHQIRSTAVSQTSSLPTVDTLKSMQRKVSS